MYELYARVAPRPEDFPRLLDKMGQSMAQDFDFSEEVRGLKVPMLFAAADADMFPPSHAVEVFELLGGGQRDGGWQGEDRPAGGHALAIIPGATHYNMSESPVLAAAVLAFLDAPRPEARSLLVAQAEPRADRLDRDGFVVAPLDEPDAGPQAGVALALVELAALGQPRLAAPVLEGQVVLLALVLDGDLERRDEDVEGLA